MNIETVMRHCITLLYLLLALAGCNEWGSATVNHTVVDGKDVIHSKTRVAGGLAQFDCLESTSGSCHYTLFPADCATSPAGGGTTSCDVVPIERFALAVGASRKVLDMPSGFRPCVSDSDVTVALDCKPLAQSAQ